LDEPSLSGIANQGLETLKELAKNGFVHGDIKGRNLIYNDQTGDLTFIDTGGMAKASKDAARTDDTMFNFYKNPLTPHYTHPGFLDNDGKLGFEQDLFSFGMTLLVASLESSNDQTAKTNAEAVLAGMKTYNGKVSRATPEQRQELYAYHRVADSNEFIRGQINQIQVQPGSVAEKGLQFINLALDQKQPVTDRVAWDGQLQGLIS
jgi:serine/threonine protein kinase